VSCLRSGRTRPAWDTFSSYGRITLLDVITEQRRYIDIETSYTDVLLDAYAARVALEQAIGARLR